MMKMSVPPFRNSRGAKMEYELFNSSKPAGWVDTETNYPFDSRIFSFDAKKLQIKI